MSVRLSPARFAFAVAVALPSAACSSTPEGAEPAAVGADSLSTADAVARAEEWVAVQLKYCQAPNGDRDYDSSCSTYCSRYSNPAWDPYRSDCSGLVSWAWGLPAPGRVTTELAPFQTDITDAISATALRAGDAVNNSGHVMLFKAWTTPGQRATFIEEPGCSASQPYAREWTSDVTTSGTQITVAFNGETFTAIRYGGLVSAPVVAPSGMDVSWTRAADGAYAFAVSAPAKAKVATVTYAVDGFAIGSGSDAAKGFAVDYTFTTPGEGRALEAKAFDAKGALVAAANAAIDVTGAPGMYVREVAEATYEIGLERAPSEVAAIQVAVDGSVLTDGVSGASRSTRMAVRSSFQTLGSRTFVLTTYGADGAARGAMTRSLTLQ